MPQPAPTPQPETPWKPVTAAVLDQEEIIPQPVPVPEPSWEEKPSQALKPPKEDLLSLADDPVWEQPIPQPDVPLWEQPIPQPDVPIRGQETPRADELLQTYAPIPDDIPLPPAQEPPLAPEFPNLPPQGEAVMQNEPFRPFPQEAPPQPGMPGMPQQGSWQEAPPQPGMPGMPQRGAWQGDPREQLPPPPVQEMTPPPYTVPGPTVQQSFGPAPVSESKKKKSGSSILLLCLLAAVFLLGLCAEIFANMPIRDLLYNPLNIPQSELRRIAYLQVLQSFGIESIPIYSAPSFLMNLMVYRAGSSTGAVLRWIPYLILFFIPVLTAFFRNRKVQSVPLFVSGGFTLLEGIGIVLASELSPIGGRILNAFYAVPFIMEAVIVILLAVSFLAKKKLLCLISGILSVLFAVDSIMLTPVILRISRMYMPVTLENILRSFRWVLSNPRALYLDAGASFWPVYKTFVLVMYALLAFFSLKKLKKES